MSALKRVKPEERFKVVSLVGDDNKRRTALQIRCCKCPAFDHLKSSGNSFLPTEKSAFKFEARGWFVAKNTTTGDRDMCPSCKSIAPPAPALKPVDTAPTVQQPEPEKVIQLMPQQTPPDKATPLSVIEGDGKTATRQPTMEQRRSILEKLYECYDMPGQAYHESWSDAKIGEKLNVPRKWIEDIREQFFGPDQNMATKKVIAALEALKPQAEKLEKECMAHAEQGLALSDRAKELQKQIDKALASL